MGAATRQPDRELRAVAIIPARLRSRRLPEKMLLCETGRPLFCHTAENVARSRAVERVVVATDAPEILEAAEKAGIEAVLTSPDHASGTDRVREAANLLGLDADHIVVNVQGDEPDLEVTDLERLIATFADPAVEIATLAAELDSQDALLDPNVVKVVCDGRGDALYFSRAPIPDRSHERQSDADAVLARRHVGVYAYRLQALERFASLPTTPLERAESLEQLRWLEAGSNMRVAPASRVSLGIDTRRDYEEFVRRCREARQNLEKARS
jgi:3-deoxy-manno-octulosonate cytidylyltransferase (CMP-KDO synthetase)